MLRTLSSFVVCLSTASLLAQATIVIPDGTANAAGDTSNAFPWGTSASTFPGLRLMAVYGAANFTNQSVSVPVVITGLKWRPDNNAPAYAGGQFSAVTIELSTSPTGWAGVTTSYASNHGADRTVVYDAALHGPVTHTATAGSGGWTPQSWCVDVPLAVPFLYDPSAGDLVIDVDYPTGSFGAGAVGQMDVQSANSNSSRIFASTNYPSANGTTLNHGPVVEVTYQPAQGYASKATYGTGCYDRPRMVQEAFPVNTPVIDLVNTSWLLIYSPTSNGGNYVIAPGGPPFDGVAPLSGTNLSAGAYTSSSSATWDDASVVYPLSTATFPSGFDFPGGNCTSITINSNGKIFLGSTTDGSFLTNGAVHGNPAGFYTLLPQLAPCLNDLDPTTGGGIYVEDPSPSGGVRITWLGISNWQETGSPAAVLNDIQCELLPGGSVIYAYGQNLGCSGSLTNDAIVGFSAGNGEPVTAPVDWSALVGYVTGDGARPLALDADARPVLGTTVNVTVSEIPAGSPLAAVIYGLGHFDPGISLAGIGMPDCFQYCSQDAVVLGLLPGATFASAFPIPNNSNFAGVRVSSQGAAYNPAAVPNVVGALASNGVEFVLDMN
ncbi:MAG: hypothetical protein KDE27_01450 [Planctomycetes bacterium]|nr:hypothetical protein [Planctomycetota bacterium]